MLKDQKIKVLVVDDEIAITDRVSTQLSSLGYKTFSANSGEGAMDMIRQCNPDVVILDIAMDNGDGGDVLHFLQNSNKYLGVKVIICSGCVTKAEAMDSSYLGGVLAIAKPASIEEIDEKIREVLNITSI